MDTVRCQGRPPQKEIMHVALCKSMLVNIKLRQTRQPQWGNEI